MPLVPMRQILDEAAKGGYGVGAFNANNMEQAQAIFRAGAETESPVIIQVSRGALKYSDMDLLVVILQQLTRMYPRLKAAIHLDHGNSVETCRKAIELGFSSVMMDGSLAEDGKTINAYVKNVEVTLLVVELAHPLGVTVEGELGALGGLEDGHGAGLSGDEVRKHLTDPNQAKVFVDATGVDCLAVAIGTSHGAYKFTRPPTGAVLRMDVIKAIHQQLPDCHLVMHGSSEVSEGLLDVIRMYGGYIKPTYGVPVREVQEGVRSGVRKINVDTDSRLAMTGAVRKIFACEPTKFDMREWLGPARDAMQAVVKSRMISFGSAGHNNDYEPMTLDDMKKAYGY